MSVHSTCRAAVTLWSLGIDIKKDVVLHKVPVDQRGISERWLLICLLGTSVGLRDRWYLCSYI